MVPEARDATEAILAELEPEDDKLVIFAWSGELDKMWPTLILATTGAAMGMEVTVFFTFWGLSILKKKNASAAMEKDLMQRMFTMMTPGSSEALGVSKMNYFGIGAKMLRTMMKKQGVSSLEEIHRVTGDRLV